MGRRKEEKRHLSLLTVGLVLLLIYWVSKLLSYNRKRRNFNRFISNPFVYTCNGKKRKKAKKRR